MLKCKCRMIKRYTYVRLSSMNKLFLYGGSMSKSVLSSQQTPHSLVGSKQVTHPQLKSSQSERFSQNIQVQDANNQYSWSQIQHKDWFVIIDLKDTYFHTENLPQHRMFLRLSFGGDFQWCHHQGLFKPSSWSVCHTCFITG